MNEQIKEISELMKSQNTHCTSDPIYLVEQKIREYGQDSDYCDESEWVDRRDDWLPVQDKDLIEKLDSFYDDELPAEYSEIYSKLYYRDRWEYITVFFTEKHAKEWIENNKHRYGDGEGNNLRVYVDSAYRNHHLQNVRALLLEQTK